MNRIAIPFAFLAMSAVVAQAEELPQEKHLKAWAEEFAGAWVNESVLEEDVGPMKKGTKFTAYHSFEWSPDKEALFLQYRAEAGGNTFNTTKGIAGWDGSKNAVVVRWFNSLGANGEFSYTAKGQEWTMVWHSTDSEGTESAFIGTTTIAGDRQHIHMTNRKVGEEAKPDRDITWTRKP
jgi:hypothetical protein